MQTMGFGAWAAAAVPVIAGLEQLGAITAAGSLIQE
jgi:hypothetical protein